MPKSLPPPCTCVPEVKTDGVWYGLASNGTRQHKATQHKARLAKRSLGRRLPSQSIAVVSIRQSVQSPIHVRVVFSPTICVSCGCIHPRRRELLPITSHVFLWPLFLVWHVCVFDVAFLSSSQYRGFTSKSLLCWSCLLLYLFNSHGTKVCGIFDILKLFFQKKRIAGRKNTSTRIYFWFNSKFFCSANSMLDLRNQHIFWNSFWRQKKFSPLHPVDRFPPWLPQLVGWCCGKDGHRALSTERGRHVHLQEHLQWEAGIGQGLGEEWLDPIKIFCASTGLDSNTGAGGTVGTNSPLICLGGLFGCHLAVGDGWHGQMGFNDYRWSSHLCKSVSESGTTG